MERRAAAEIRPRPSPGPWRELEDQGTYRLSLPTPFPVGPVNVFLIEDEPLTLVDCGTSAAASIECLEAELAAVGHRLEEIELLLLTHQHVDHMGGAREVARRSGAEVACVAALAPYLEDFETAVSRDDAIVVSLLRAHGVPDSLTATAIAAAGDRRPYGQSVRIDVPIAEGGEIMLRDRRLRLLRRPGHSPSDTIFVDPERRSMFGGDHLLLEISSNALIGPGLDGADDSYQPLVSYRESLRATYELALDLVIPGHGEPIRNHRTLIDERIAQQDRRACQFLDLLAGGARSAHEIACERWGATAQEQVFLTTSEVVGHLDLMVAAGSARRLVGDAGVLFEAA